IVALAAGEVSLDQWRHGVRHRFVRSQFGPAVSTPLIRIRTGRSLALLLCGHSLIAGHLRAGAVEEAGLPAVALGRLDALGYSDGCHCNRAFYHRRRRPPWRSLRLRLAAVVSARDRSCYWSSSPAQTTRLASPAPRLVG